MLFPSAITVKGFSGGADIESAAELLSRLEYRVQLPSVRR
ncbi:baseplate J/gp47 family protein [Escherichia coli]